MININAQQYTETPLTNLHIKETYPLQQWIHTIVEFSSPKMPDDIIEPEILVILNQQNEVLQIILHEEGCDSPNYQLTDHEKEQITTWLSKQNKHGF